MVFNVWERLQRYDPLLVSTVVGKVWIHPSDLSRTITRCPKVFWFKMHLLQAQVSIPNNYGFLPEVQNPLDQQMELFNQWQPLRQRVLREMVG